MPTRLVWSHAARNDLLDLYETVALERRAAAERYFGRIEAKTQSLVAQPRMGMR